MEPQPLKSNENLNQLPDASVGIPTDSSASGERRDISPQYSHSSKTPMVVAGITLLLVVTGILLYQNIQLNKRVVSLDLYNQQLQNSSQSQYKPQESSSVMYEGYEFPCLPGLACREDGGRLAIFLIGKDDPTQSHVPSVHVRKFPGAYKRGSDGALESWVMTLYKNDPGVGALQWSDTPLPVNCIPPTGSNEGCMPPIGIFIKERSVGRIVVEVRAISSSAVIDYIEHMSPSGEIDVYEVKLNMTGQCGGDTDCTVLDRQAMKIIQIILQIHNNQKLL